MTKRLKPLPYMVLQDSYPHYQQAKWLRKLLSPLMARRLPTLAYGGFKHGFIPNFVQQHKKAFPYFFTADIEKFYVSIPHKTLLVSGQLAYKYLVGASYVPTSFSKPYCTVLRSFFETLPVRQYGIPISSAMSSALAPVFWVPLLKSYKKNEDLRFIVFADDILVMSQNSYTLEKAYYKLQNYLTENELRLSLSKVKSGHVGSEVFQFCGYRFSGGYVGVSNEKVAVFKEKIQQIIKKKSTQPQALTKKLNYAILGFGHYYKYAHTKKLFCGLDAYIRVQIRKNLSYSNSVKKSIITGLHTLERIYTGVAVNKYTQKSTKRSYKPKSSQSDALIYLKEYQEKLISQNKEIIGLLKKIKPQVEQIAMACQQI